MRIPKHVQKISLGIILCLLLLWGADFLCPPHLERFHDLSRTLYDKDGALLHCTLNKDEKWQLPVEVDDVQLHFLDLLIHTEDKRFYMHPGVDPLALLRACGKALLSLKVRSGGSTLTMQVARLLEPRPRTVISKLLEILRALQLEWHYSKKDILNMYLTLAPYGGNVQGVRAASLYYFGKSPKSLTLSDAALLVALPQSPTKFSKNTLLQKKWRDRILNQSHLSKTLMREALQDKLPGERYPFPRLAPHVMAMAPSFSAQTTLVKDLQQQLEHLIKTWPTQPLQSIAAIIVDKNGAICAYVGSKDFFNSELSGQVNMLSSVRSPGSTLKPFIYALAFEEGWLHPKTILHDVSTNFEGYTPTNFNDNFHGDIIASEALQKSLNIPAVSILEKLGPRYFFQTLVEIGISLRLPSLENNISLPIALGGVGVCLVDLAILFNTLNCAGNVMPLTVWKDLSHKNSVASFNPKKLFSEKTATRLISILTHVPLPPTMVEQPLKNGKIAFKTGTSYGHRDALAVGVNGTHTVLVWMGRADGAPVLRQTGLTCAAPLLLSIFHKFLGSRGFLHEENADPMPEKLRHLGRKNSLCIHFPRTGSKLQKNVAHPISVTGGTPPYTVFLNGQRVNSYPLKTDVKLPHTTNCMTIKSNLRDFSLKKRTLLSNISPGFHHIVLIDTQGERTQSSFQVMR